MLQIAPPREIDHFSANYGRTPWCYPAVSFHHLRPAEIKDITAMEKGLSQRSGVREPVLWRDVFLELARPRMSEGNVLEWNNQAPEERTVVRSIEACRRLCERDTHCLQYMRRDDGMCCFGRDARLGVERKGFASGWMVDRIDAMANMLGSCPHPNWIV